MVTSGEVEVDADRQMLVLFSRQFGGRTMVKKEGNDRNVRHHDVGGVPDTDYCGSLYSQEQLAVLIKA